MIPAFILLSCLLTSVYTAQSQIPPIDCMDHSDCVSAREYEGFGSVSTFALCEHIICIDLHPKKECKKPNNCGWHRSCRDGRFILGGLSAACRTDSVNSMPGFACDSATRP